VFSYRRHRRQCICQDWNLGRFGKGRASACGWNLLDGDAGGAYAWVYTAEAYASTAEAYAYSAEADAYAYAVDLKPAD
jgi:hypothetical protein